MLKWVAAAVAVALVLVGAAVLAVPYVVDTPRVQALISHSASQALGRPVKFASLSVSVFPLPAVMLKDLRVSEDPRFGTKPFLTIGTGSLRLRVWPLLSGRVEFSELVLQKLQVTLVRDRGGRMNIATLGAPAAAPQGGRSSAGRAGGAPGVVPVVSRIRIIGGLVTYTAQATSAATSYRLGDLNLTLQGTNSAAPVRFTGEARLQPGGLRFTITDGSVTVAGGRLPLDAPLSARVAIEGVNVADLAGLALGPVPELGGPVKGALVVSGTLGAPSIAGAIESSKLTVSQARPACSEPKRRTLTLEPVRLPVSFSDDVLTSQRFATRLAGAAITAVVVVSLRDGTLLRVRDLAIRTLPLAPVLVDYLCERYAVTGPLDLTGEVSARPAALWATLSGSGSLKIGPGKVVGPQALKLLEVVRLGGVVASALGADLPARSATSPLDFDSITGTYVIRNGVVATDDLHYTSRAMQVSVAGRYGLVDEQMNLDVVMKAGRGEIAAKVTGSAASPSVRVNPSALLKGKRLERGARELERGVRGLLERLR